MRNLFAMMTAVAALAVCCPATADPLADSVTWQLTLGYEFGDVSALHRQAHMTALLDARSLRRGEDARLSTQDEPDAAPRFVSALPLLTVLQLGATARGLDRAEILGRDLLNAQGQAGLQDGSEGGHQWLWWTLGGVAVAAGIAIGVSGGHHDEDSAQSAPPNNCSLSGNAGSTQFPGICPP